MADEEGVPYFENRDGSYLEREIREMAHVPRWPMTRLTRQQFLAEHSYFVAVYAIRLVDVIAPTLPDSFKYKVVRAALFHDLDEIVTGDISGPTKKAIFKHNPDVKHEFKTWARKILGRRLPWAPKYLDESEDDGLVKFIVGLADLIEARLFLSEEHNAGNRNVRSLASYIAELIEQHLTNPRMIDAELKAKIEVFIIRSIEHEQTQQSITVRAPDDDIERVAPERSALRSAIEGREPSEGE